LPIVHAYRWSSLVLLNQNESSADREGSGPAHHPEQADKDGQVNPVGTGSAYVDEVPLPLVRRTGFFVDQESWMFSSSHLK
jgi:hypothetical protein